MGAQCGRKKRIACAHGGGGCRLLGRLLARSTRPRRVGWSGAFPIEDPLMCSIYRVFIFSALLAPGRPIRALASDAS
jgi:hypothetical protein